MLLLTRRPSLRSLTLKAALPGGFIADETTKVMIAGLQDGASIDLDQVHGRSVMLRTTAQLPTVLAALDLDGVATRIVLFTPDQESHLSVLKRQAATDIVVGDPTVPVDLQLRLPVWQRDRDIETEWVLLTSGTTGVPKLAIHTLSSLTGPLDDGLAATSGIIWSTFYDVRRYGGLQMLLRALLGGGSMVLSSQDEKPTEFLLRLRRNRVTHVSGTPSHWRRALMSEAATAFSPSYVRLSGEIVDQSILDRLKRTYPMADIGHAFASTEAGVAFDVRDGKAGFPASYIGSPDLKAELRVVDNTLRIRSSRTARSYIGAPLNRHNGFVDTGDLVVLRGDRYYFGGRKEGIINVGGQKVYPGEVESIISQHPAVRMTRVWARRNPIIGSLVAADIMLLPGLTLAGVREDLLSHCRQHLEAWKVPASLHEVTSIPLSPAGKIVRA